MKYSRQSLVRHALTKVRFFIHCTNFLNHYNFLIQHDLILPAQCISESCIKVKIKLNVYLHTSL